MKYFRISRMYIPHLCRLSEFSSVVDIYSSTCVSVTFSHSPVSNLKWPERFSLAGSIFQTFSLFGLLIMKMCDCGNSWLQPLDNFCIKTSGDAFQLNFICQELIFPPWQQNPLHKPSEMRFSKHVQG